jgi:glycosyltransferase involved in cell wall biosynthesis
MPSEKRSKKRVLLLCPHPEGYVPGQRLKYEQYLDIFREEGFEVTVSPFMSEAFQKIVYTKGRNVQKAFWTLAGYARRMMDLLRIRRYDVIYVFLWVTPFGPPLFERLVRLLSRRMVYDIDDMIYLQDHRSQANPLISKLKGKNKPVYLFRVADTVITSTDSIEDFARRLNPNVVHIPVTINTRIYTPRIDYKLAGQQLVLGWTGSYSTSPYLHLLDDVLRKLREKFDFRLLVMGDENFRIEGIDVQAIPWKESYEVETIRRFDIGLYPLPVNDWVLGKGGGKALQYMALGVPTVATGIGANFKIITPGVDGFLVKTDEEWIEALSALMQDQSLRESIGKKGITTIEEKYSVNSNKFKYLQILNK